MATVVLVVVFALLCAIQTARVLIAWGFLRTLPQFKLPSEGPVMHLLVPVAFEQTIIASSFERFRALLAGRPWLQVVFITTARESRSAEQPTTHAMLEELLKTARDARIRLISDPRPYGVMAHQLNYAVDAIASQEDLPFLIGLYNVDSTTAPASIDFAYTRLTENPSRVLQQYAVYPPTKDATFVGHVLSHVAAWQTRWSLHFELGRLLVDHAIFRRPRGSADVLNLFRPYHYTIGHGLFLSSTTWEWASGMAEDEINEDAFFGLLLHVSGRRIEPVPYLETAHPPPSLSAYIKQQSVWFNGPLYAFNYAWKLWFGSRGSHAKRPTARGLVARTDVGVAAVKLAMHAVSWLFGPPAMLLLTLVVVAGGNRPLAILWIILVIYFTYGLNVIAHSLSMRLGKVTGRIGGPLSAFVAYMLHCAGPLRCIARVVSGANNQQNKYKTDRTETSAL